VEFRVLGQISVVGNDGVEVPLPGASQRRLVGFLASRANTITPIGSIALHLDLSEGAVRTGIARLRRRLGGPGCDLVTVGPGYMLATDRIDRVQFERASSAASTAGVADTDRRSSLEQALGMWRGDAFAEFAHEEWAATEAVRLDDLRASATETLVDVLLALGAHEEALQRAAELIHRHPFRDRPRGQQMRALASMGRVTESLRSFQEYRALLIEEVGTVPSAALAELEQLIATGRLPHDDVHMLPTRTAPEPTEIRHVMLPRNVAFGLDEISRRVASDLAEHELVTLTGIGGVGKTRLALTVAARASAAFDRVVLVDLRSVSSADAVRAAAARALAVETSTTASDVRPLHRCTTLVVFDNCEHVLEVAGALISEILRGPASVRVLTTSRHPLGVAGEHVRSVPTLSSEDAVALFIDRASRWRDGVTDDDAASRRQITEICDALDRVPLAVELAAACVVHMTVGEIAAQLHERLTFLPGDPTRLEQHRTLRATMDWSYGLLDDDAQSLLRALSAFAVEFDAAAAAAVWERGLPDTLAALGTLARASLVVARSRRDATRYELLETVRPHAEEKAGAAGEIERVRRAHADHYASALEAIDTVELLRPVSERRPDVANHERLLEWIAARDEPRRLGRLAWRVAMAHRAECWSDPPGRYLGRDDVASALTEPERSWYLAASFENANILGRWADQLRFADLALETATGPVRVALLRGAASACTVLAMV
jgi:predicted ATPase/DNA-binding SARP family transcriptional activator